MKYILITTNPEIEAAFLSPEAFFPTDEKQVFAAWKEALEACDNTEILFVELVGTLSTPHEIAGYEEFALAKMDHPVAGPIPLVLLAPPPDYDLDFMVGWPDFVFAQIPHPVTPKLFRRASTWI